jgi:hypothetical protein
MKAKRGGTGAGKGRSTIKRILTRRCDLVIAYIDALRESKPMRNRTRDTASPNARAILEAYFVVKLGWTEPMAARMALKLYPQFEEWCNGAVSLTMPLADVEATLENFAPWVFPGGRNQC